MSGTNKKYHSAIYDVGDILILKNINNRIKTIIMIVDILPDFQFEDFGQDTYVIKYLQAPSDYFINHDYEIPCTMIEHNFIKIS